MSLYMPVSKEKIAPVEYLNLSEQERKNIKKVQFVPPKVGMESGFGFFIVEYTTPKLKKEVWRCE